MTADDVRKLLDRINSNISKVITGKREAVGLILAGLVSGGHILIEDVPGTGKTMMARCLARSLDADFGRIQFTPDLLPSDLTGVNYFNQKTFDFTFREGPVFTNILLADEINRATPRTQSSLLECMEEKQVTIDGVTRKMKEPFFVIATQNPVESEGTFPLPEAQLDRFFMRIRPGYPTGEESMTLLGKYENGEPFTDVKSVASAAEIISASHYILGIRVSSEIKKYIVDLVEQTRTQNNVILGASPRAAIALMRASQALAASEGREFATPDDVKKASVPVLSHRLIVRKNITEYENEAQEAAVRLSLETVSAPVEKVRDI
jgi:MoxR-like ATPase